MLFVTFDTKNLNNYIVVVDYIEAKSITYCREPVFVTKIKLVFNFISLLFHFRGILL